jgi:hypothetical protein
MATAAQIIACAANAQHSTGPRSPEGKAVSSRNALKLGLYSRSDILPGEDPAEFDQLLHDFEAEYRPVGPVQTAAVHDLVRAIWLVRRYDRIEAQFINLRHADLTPEEQEFPLGAIYAKDTEGPNVLQKIERRRAAALRQAAGAREEIARFASAVAAPRKTASPTKHLPPDSVRFDARKMPPISTPIRTPNDNWDNPALRL